MERFSAADDEANFPLQHEDGYDGMRRFIGEDEMKIIP